MPPHSPDPPSRPSTGKRLRFLSAEPGWPPKLAEIGEIARNPPICTKSVDLPEILPFPPQIPQFPRILDFRLLAGIVCWPGLSVGWNRLLAGIVRQYGKRERRSGFSDLRSQYTRVSAGLESGFGGSYAGLDFQTCAHSLVNVCGSLCREGLRRLNNCRLGAFSERSSQARGFQSTRPKFQMRLQAFKVHCSPF